MPEAKVLASSAFDILNELMGEIHARRIIAILAENTPSLFQTKHPDFVIRIGEGAVLLALSKFIDLWDHQITKLLGNEAPVKGYELRKELREKKITEFRNLFVAHYSDRKSNPKQASINLEHWSQPSASRMQKHLLCGLMV